MAPKRLSKQKLVETAKSLLQRAIKRTGSAAGGNKVFATLLKRLTHTPSTVLVASVFHNVAILLYNQHSYNVWCVMCDVWCMMCDVWCMMYDVWCVMYDVWCMMYDVWCMMYQKALQLFRSAMSVYQIKCKAQHTSPNYSSIYHLMARCALKLNQCKVLCTRVHTYTHITHTYTHTYTHTHTHKVCTTQCQFLLCFMCEW